ncbi:MAG TPA: glycosyltransferase family 2 protein [Gammaproteobacteria bacterium]|nr:glycosyltransferase family 2 protein [Gammaproteobacteria bacterium]
MTVAIVVVNYQSDELLLQCLDKLECQTTKPDQIIVVDNHDEEHDLSQVAKRFPLVRVLSAGSNIGFAAAANLGISHSVDVEYVALLNPDAFPDSGWLAALLQAADENPECGSYSSMMVMAHDPETLDGGGDALHFSGVPWRVGHGGKKAGFSSDQAGMFSACAGAALYQVRALREAGGFDESFFMYVEDVDLGFRLQLLGYPCCFVSYAVVYHIGSAISGYKSDFSLYFGHRNLVWSYFKNMPWQLLLVTLPFHIAMNLATIIVYALRGRGVIILRSKWDAVKGLPNVLRQRGLVKRQVSIVHLWKLMDKSLGVSRI